jgi:F0F1-type ATP synthase delta subunit
MSAGRAISRRKLAKFVADRLQHGEADDAIRQVAAYLLETKQTRNIGLLVRDIEELLSEDGVIVADTVSARPLSREDKAAVVALLGGREVQLREHIDPTVLGGVRISAPGRRLDATLKHKIDSLKETRLRKGTA